MARPALWNHRKFRRLTIALKSKAMAAGVLECMWACGYDSGDDILGTSEEVEIACGWSGKKGALTPLLLSVGWIDKGEDGYRIHDLFDHAPEYVQNRIKREEKRRQRPISDQSVINQRPISDQSVIGTPLSHHPSPITHHPTPSPPNPQATATGFEDFWNHYPRKSGREAALRAWLSVVTNGDAAAIMASLAWQVESDEWRRESGRFVPKAENYLFEKRWTDEKPAGAYVAPDGEPF